MPINANQIFKVTEDIWSSVLGLEIKMVDEVAGTDKKRVASFVQVMGAWEGSVILDCTEDLSKLFASKMFSLPVNEIGNEEVLDALGELVNILGGNIRSFLPQPSQLSLPASIEGWDYTLRFPGGEGVNQVVFECGEGQFFGVTILKQSESNTFSKTVKQD